MTNYQQQNSEATIDYFDIIRKYLKYWYYYPLSILIACTVSYFFNKYAQQEYSSTATVVVQVDKEDYTDMMKGFGLFSNQKDVEAEIAILKSFTLAKKTVKQLNLEVSYYQEEAFFSSELYVKSPIVVLFDSIDKQPTNLRFYVEIINNNDFVIEVNSQISPDDTIQDGNDLQDNAFDYHFKKKFHFGEVVQSKYFKFKLLLSPSFSKKNINQHYYFVFNDLNQLALNFQSQLSVNQGNKESKILFLTLIGTNYKKIIDLLNALTFQYLERDLKRRNTIASNTINFINSQLSLISDSLQFSETKLQNFRSTNKIANIAFQSQKLIEKLQQLENEKATNATKIKYYQHIKSYIESSNEQNSIIAPSSLGINDPLLNSKILELSNLYSEKITLQYNSNKKNPYLNVLNIKIENVRKTLLENISNILSNTNLQQDEILTQIINLTEQVSIIPKTERELIGFERLFKLNDDIYTYLIRQRAEAQIAKATNLPSNEVIDYANKYTTSIIYPKRFQNYIFGILIGLLLPTLFFFMKEVFQNNITERNEIERITKKSVIGLILHNDKKINTVVSDFPMSAVTESFRTLRSKLQFYTKNKEKQIILLTSTLSSEGKTFISTNLATVFATLGKKTVLLGYDLRKPKIFNDFNLSNDLGITTFLINRYNIQNLINKTSIENFDIITSGPIPPNPSELIASIETKKLIDELQTIYDYIIIDTAPIGLVSDAYLLMPYADICIYVVRQNKTPKKAFASIFEELETHNIPNLCLVINDVKRLYSSYSSNYNYYYVEDDLSFFNKVLNWLRTLKPFEKKNIAS